MIFLVGCAAAPRVDGRSELARARTAAARGQASEAMQLYDEVPRFSPAWPRSLVEASRERARNGFHSRALGLLLTLRAPQLRDWVFPEAYAIEADIYLRNCYYRRAEALADEFRRDVLPLRGALDGTDVPTHARWIAKRVEDGSLDSLRHELDDAEAALERIVEDARHQRVKVRDNDDDTSIPMVPTVVTDNNQRWNFDGTFWPDELGLYQVPIHSRCVPVR